MGETRVMAVALLAASVIGVSACGDDGSSSKSTSLVKQPSPKQAIVSEVAPFNRAIGARDCKAYTRLLFSTVRGRPPGAPATAAECARAPRFALVGAGFSATGQYGTGALMEKLARGGAPAGITLWALDGDRRFRFTQATAHGRPQIGTRFAGGAKAVRLATGFLQAVRRRDCGAVERSLSADARLVFLGGSRRAACRSFVKGIFLAPALRKTPKPNVVAMGGTRDYGFVGIQTRDTFFTVLVAGEGSANKLRILDVLPSTPVKLPKT